MGAPEAAWDVETVLTIEDLQLKCCECVYLEHLREEGSPRGDPLCLREDFVQRGNVSIYL